MARIKIGQKTKPRSWQQTFTARVKTGKVVPIIGGQVGHDLVLGGHDKLVAAYADQVGYKPGCETEQRELSQVAQYMSIVGEEEGQIADVQAVKEFYLTFVKSWLFQLAENDGLPTDLLEELDEEFDYVRFHECAARLGYPRFDQQQAGPFLVLADFPLPIYLTTCYHNFMELALKRAGKQPHTAVCRWHEGLQEKAVLFDHTGQPVAEEDYQPSAPQPLVYHLHGYDEYAESLVLTEDDYLEFLVAISQHRGRGTDVIPRRVRRALADSSLMLLGYDLHSWDFRVLFWGLIKADFQRRYKSVCVQVPPESESQKYLQGYLSQAEFEVYWGDIQQYIDELRQSLEE